jgi:perosamine synthetase
MVTTDDSQLADRLRLFRGQGMDPQRRYWFPVVGFNYRMTNIQAAIGLAQMETIEQALETRRRLAGCYTKAFQEISPDEVVLPSELAGYRHSYWMYNIFLKNGAEEKRDFVMEQLSLRGIETRPVFYPMHILPPYREEQTYPVADNWAQRGVNLPTHENVTFEDVDFIVSSVAEILSMA